MASRILYRQSALVKKIRKNIEICIQRKNKVLHQQNTNIKPGNYLNLNYFLNFFFGTKLETKIETHL
jgi:hypothetical protein